MGATDPSVASPRPQLAVARIDRHLQTHAHTPTPTPLLYPHPDKVSHTQEPQSCDALLVHSNTTPLSACPQARLANSRVAVGRWRLCTVSSPCKCSRSPTLRYPLVSGLECCSAKLVLFSSSGSDGAGTARGSPGRWLAARCRLQTWASACLPAWTPGP